MGKAQTFQVEASHEGINKADRVLVAHVVIQSFREEGNLIPVHPFDMLHRSSPGGQRKKPDLPYTTPDFSHSLSLKLTRLAAENVVMPCLPGCARMDGPKPEPPVS